MQQPIPKEGAVLLQQRSLKAELDAQRPAQRFQLHRVHLPGAGLDLPNHALHRVGGEHARDKKNECDTDPNGQRPRQYAKNEIFAEFQWLHPFALQVDNRISQ